MNGRKHQRQPAQAVIPEQQPAIVVAVRQPARHDGAEEIEYAHGGEQARGLHLRDAEIDAHRDQVHLDQAVGAGAADRRRSQTAPRTPATSMHRAACRARPRRSARCWAAGAGSGSVPVSPNGRRPTSLGRSRMSISTANAETPSMTHMKPRRDAPAVALGEAREQRQEDQLPGGDARGHDADHEPAPCGKPARGDGRAQHQRGHAGARSRSRRPTAASIARPSSWRAR